jgi:D-aminopeptidase
VRERRLCNSPRDARCKRNLRASAVADSKLSNALHVLSRAHPAARRAATAAAAACSGGACTSGGGGVVVDDAPTSTLPALASAEELEQEKQCMCF